MKQSMIIWMLAMLLTGTSPATAATAAQSHRHTPRTSVVDDKSKQQAKADSAAAAQQETVAYSDTTAAATNDEWEDDSQPSAYRVQYQSQWNNDDREFTERILDKIATSGYYIFAIVFIIFIGAPLLLLMIILYFINRNRRDRIRLAELAIKHGQPIPGTERVVYREAKPKEERRVSSAPQPTVINEYSYDEELRAKGIKHLAIGVGLMACCILFWDNDFFGGIGFLIACFGGGQIWMARTARKPVSMEQNTDNTASEEPKSQETDVVNPEQ